MEITVRTYDEVSNERVRIEVAPGQRAEIQIVDDRVSTYDPARLYTAEEVGDLQASEAELVAAPLRRRIKELEAELVKRPTFGALRDMTNGKDLALGELQTVRAERDRHKARIQELSGRVLKAEGQAREYDLDRKTEHNRADRNKARAERAEQRLADLAEENRQSLAARDGLLATATQKVNSARELLSAGEVHQARRMDLTRTGTVMAHAIGAALRVLDQA